MTDYTNWPLIGQGKERSCYLNPDDPTRLVKFSPIRQSTQTQREIRYFNTLIKKGVPFDFIPRYYGEIHEKNRLGIEQEFIADKPGSSCAAPIVGDYVSQLFAKEEIAEFRKAYFQLKDYLLRWNVIPADLVPSNVVVSKTSSGIRLVMVDGLGGTELIPLSNWFHFLGKRKIERKWAKFTRKVNAINNRLNL